MRDWPRDVGRFYYDFCVVAFWVCSARRRRCRQNKTRVNRLNAYLQLWNSSTCGAEHVPNEWEIFYSRGFPRIEYMSCSVGFCDVACVYLITGWAYYKSTTKPNAFECVVYIQVNMCNGSKCTFKTDNTNIVRSCSRDYSGFVSKCV